jgi:hypothetical protein
LTGYSQRYAIPVMPKIVPGIHVFVHEEEGKQDVDRRDI